MSESKSSKLGKVNSKGRKASKRVVKERVDVTPDADVQLHEPEVVEGTGAAAQPEKLKKWKRTARSAEAAAVDEPQAPHEAATPAKLELRV